MPESALYVRNKRRRLPPPFYFSIFFDMPPNLSWKNLSGLGLSERKNQKKLESTRENWKGLIPMERYYQPEIETASQEQIRAWQDERLVKQVKHVWDNVPYYRKKMEEKGLTPDDIKGVDDLHKLPFVTKADLREAYPYGLVAKPLKDCVRIQSTSGTTGKRVVAFYTQHDIDLWEDCCARAIVAAGGTNEDVCQVSYGYGLFTGGPGLNGRQPQGWLSDHPHLLRQYGAADHVYPGLKRHHSVLHPLLRGLPGRVYERDGPDPRPDSPEGGHLWGRGVERGDAPRHPEYTGY